MATKVDKKTNIEPQPVDTSELEVLFPDHQLTIGGKEITIRELRFAEQLRWQPVLNEMAKSLDGLDLANANFFEDALSILGTHAEQLLDIVAFCCDQPRDWIEALPAGEGEELLITWWTANNSFFVRRLLRRGIMGQIAQAAAGE